MDHSEDEQLSNYIQENSHSDEVAHRCQCAAHESRPVAASKHQAPKEWWVARAGVLYTIARTQHDCSQRLEDDSQAAGSMQARDHVVDETSR